MKSVVLCAGFGTRLGDLTRDRPKAMLPVAGKPLLAHTLGWLAANGVKEVAVNLHHAPDLIPAAFGDGREHGVTLHYSREPEILGTAGALRPLARWLSRDQEFLLVYGDLLLDQPLEPLVRLHRERRALATLLVHRRAGSNSVLRLAPDGRVLAFLERPGPEEIRAVADPWVNSGVHVLSREALDLVPEGCPSDLPRDVLIPAVRTGRVHGYPLEGFRCAIDSPERYAFADDAVRRGRWNPVRPAGGIVG